MQVFPLGCASPFLSSFLFVVFSLLSLCRYKSENIKAGAIVIFKKWSSAKIVLTGHSTVGAPESVVVLKYILSWVVILLLSTYFIIFFVVSFWVHYWLAVRKYVHRVSILSVTWGVIISCPCQVCEQDKWKQIRSW
jgi:type IV secretory pathway TrbD component